NPIHAGARSLQASQRPHVPDLQRNPRSRSRPGLRPGHAKLAKYGDRRRCNHPAVDESTNRAAAIAGFVIKRGSKAPPQNQITLPWTHSRRLTAASRLSHKAPRRSSFLERRFGTTNAKLVIRARAPSRSDGRFGIPAQRAYAFAFVRDSRNPRLRISRNSG